MGKMIIFMEKYTFSALLKKIILLNWLLRNRHFHEHVEWLKILLCRPVCSCIDQWDVMKAVTWHQQTNHSLMQNLWRRRRRRRRRRNSFGLRVGLFYTLNFSYATLPEYLRNEQLYLICFKHIDINSIIRDVTIYLLGYEFFMNLLFINPSIC